MDFCISMDAKVCKICDWRFSNKMETSNGWQCISSCDQAALRTLLCVCPSVPLSVTPFSQCSCHRIIMKFSGVITHDKSDVHTKSQSQRLKVKVTEVKTQYSRFRTVTPVWIWIWWWNDAQSLMLLKRGSLYFFKVICQVWIHRWLWNDAQSLV